MPRARTNEADQMLTDSINGDFEDLNLLNHGTVSEDYESFLRSGKLTAHQKYMLSYLIDSIVGETTKIVSRTSLNGD